MPDKLRDIQERIREDKKRYYKNIEYPNIPLAFLGLNLFFLKL